MRPCAIISTNPTEAWAELLETLVKEGRPRQPRGFNTLERRAVTVQLPIENNVIFHPSRNLNYRFMVAEWLWVWYGFETVPVISQYNSRMAEFSDDGQVLAGAYGPRLRSQRDAVEHLLSTDPFTRQAVQVIYSPNPTPSKDIPCTVAFQWFRDGDRLDLIVTMRSSDVWLGFPYDLFTFSQYANCLAARLRLTPGTITMQLGSSHLYEKDYVAAGQVLASLRRARYYRSPRLFTEPMMSGTLYAPENSRVKWSEHPDNPESMYANILTHTRAEALPLIEELDRYAQQHH